MPPAAIDRFLERAMPALRAEERLVGVAAGGSFVQGEMDEQSDLDLVLVVRDAAFPEVLRGRMELARKLGSLLAAFSGEHVGEPRLLICLYGPPLLHVDLKFVALRDFASRVENPKVLWEREGALSAILGATPCEWPAPQLQWIEDRFWIWIHYAAAKLARGELFEVIDMLGFLRAQVLGPLAMFEQGQRPQGARRLETHATRWVAALRETLALHDRSSCAAAIRAAVRLYRDLRARVVGGDVVLRAAAEDEVVRYLESVTGRNQDTGAAGGLR